jgi:hypothetical protein
MQHQRTKEETAAARGNGKARTRTLPARDGYDIDPLRAQHLQLARGLADTGSGPTEVLVDESESPLLWLARRKGRDGAPLIAAHQLQAGERLRGEFTRANLMPRTTSNWHAPTARDRRSGDQGLNFTEVMIAARQGVNNALEAVGPEFSGLLLDVCCFLKGLIDIERERAWPPRSAKVVLQIALDRLARHYGYGAEARGRTYVPIRVWAAADFEGDDFSSASS